MLNYIKAKKFSLLFLVLILILSMFVLDTPKPVSKDNETQFSAVRAQAHIEAISRHPHSYYDRVEHEEVRMYLIDTLTDYLGAANVFEYNYSTDDVVNLINEVNATSSYEYSVDDVLYPVENVLGVLPGENAEGILLMAHYDSRGHVGRSGEQGRSYGAMDDGYGVSTMLEFAYLLRNENPKNSVYFLFTDAEEVGLYGALMASKEDDIMNNIRFVINLESRGRFGPTYMFETSKNNHKVIELYKKANLPVTYSMATAVYSVMPNFTDFTPLIDTGVPGLNFATLAGLDNYHSPLDRYENINISSIQHMGSQVEPIIKTFISDAKYIEPNYFDANTNQIFFTLFSGVLVSYSKTFAIILLVLAILLFAFITVLKLKEQKLSKDIVTKTLPKGLAVFIGMIVIGILYGMIVAFLGKVPFGITYTRVSNTEIPTVILLVALTLGLTKLISKNKVNVLYLGVGINLLLAILTTFILEGASFLFLFTAFSGLVAMYTGFVQSKHFKVVLYTFSYALMFFIMIPLLYSFYMALTVGGTVVLTVLLTLNGIVTLPIILKRFDLDY